MEVLKWFGMTFVFLTQLRALTAWSCFLSSYDQCKSSNCYKLTQLSRLIDTFHLAHLFYLPFLFYITYLALPDDILYSAASLLTLLSYFLSFIPFSPLFDGHSSPIPHNIRYIPHLNHVSTPYPQSLT